ncbi:MAG: hypothetical protein R6V54_00855 [Desulfobacteraceae bacterium]
MMAHFINRTKQAGLISLMAAVVLLVTLPTPAAIETAPLSDENRDEAEQKPAASGEFSSSGLKGVYDYFTATWLKKLKHPGAKISLAYVLRPKRWIAFHLPLAPDRIKIITNANVPDDTAPEPEREISYALDYQIVDNTGKIIKSGRYHKKTRITRYREAGTGKGHTASFYFSDPLVPADSRVVILSLAGIAGQRDITLRFRTAELAPEVFDAVMRFYSPEKTPESQLDRMWQRTSKAKKTHLSRANVYPEEFLTGKEQANLMRQVWQPLAPRGVEGKDYDLRKLYVIKEPFGMPVGRPVLYKGVLMDRDLKRTLAVAEEGMTLEFRFSRVERPDENAPRRARVGLTWFGKGREVEQQTILLNNSPGPTIHKQQFNGGLIELKSHDRPLAVQVFHVVDGESIDITPNPITTRAFRISRDRKAVYRISHVQGLATPFRASFRSEMHQETDFPGQVSQTTRQTVHYALMDARGNTVKQGRLRLTLTPSAYDRTSREGNRVVLSEPSLHFFRIPPEVTRLALWASAPLLVNAHNRPPDRPKTTRVPEDYFTAEPEGTNRQTTWFPLRPETLDPLSEQKHSTLISIQHRPPEIDPFIGRGAFKWDGFSSSSRGKGHYLLVPAEKKEYHRSTSLVSNFKEIPGNQSLRLDFRSAGDLETMRPSLVYYLPEMDGEAATPADPIFSIELVLDNKRFFHREIMGRTGKIRLPPVTKGKHQLVIRSQSRVKTFVNCILSDAPGYYLRFAQLLNKNSVTFQYRKQSREDETLSLGVFFPDTAPQRMRFRVELGPGTVSKRIGPLKGLTVPKRIFSVRSDANGPVYVLNSSSPVLASFQSCFFPIRPDLKPGQYPVTIFPETDQKAYVFPYRLLPGIYPERRFQTKYNMASQQKDLQ